MKTSHIMVALVAAFAVLGAAVALGVLDPIAANVGGVASAMAIQTAYNTRMPVGLPGQIADMSTADVDSRVCETSAGIGFGLAVGIGSADRGCVLGSAAATGFLGVSVKDVANVNADQAEYAQYSEMPVLYRGDIWVTVGGDVADGENVTYNKTTGVLSSIGADSDNFAITGARWMTTATSGNIAKLRLGGTLPSA